MDGIVQHVRIVPFPGVHPIRLERLSYFIRRGVCLDEHRQVHGRELDDASMNITVKAGNDALDIDLVGERFGRRIPPESLLAEFAVLVDRFKRNVRTW